MVPVQVKNHVALRSLFYGHTVQLHQRKPHVDFIEAQQKTVLGSKENVVFFVDLRLQTENPFYTALNQHQSL
jgi:hypothetical protein